MVEYKPSNPRSLGADGFEAENAREVRIGKEHSFAQTPGGKFVDVVKNTVEFDLDGVYRQLTGMVALGQNAEILIPSNVAFALIPDSGNDGYFASRFKVWWEVQLEELKSKLGMRYEGLDFHLVFVGEDGQPVEIDEMENMIPCVAIKLM